MAAVIRVKRRRDEDPVEALLLSQKKSRLDSASANGNEDKIDSILEFAGTLSSKNEPVATHIKEAIKKKKLHRQLHPHSTDSKSTPELISKVRAQSRQTSQNNRYHIKVSRRALDIDSLDSVHFSDEEGRKISSSLSHPASGEVDEIGHANSSSLSKEKISDLSESDAESHRINSSPEPASDERVAQAFNENPAEDSDKSANKVFCLLDVEHHHKKNVSQASASGITVNNVPMVSLPSPVPIEEESDDYVYDLYYTHTQLRESHLEAVLTVEAMCNELVCPERENSDDDEVGDLDEDSNDESNWRNDYPDEDPGFLDNEGRDYDYSNDMVQRNMGGSDDEGDLLSYWMDTRCRIEVDCDELANDDSDKTDGSSEDEYKDDES